MAPSRITPQPNVAAAAALLADPARAAMVMALMEDISLPAGELATAAGVSPQSASGHLSRLRASGFVSVFQNGRHRYYRLANASVAVAVEALATLTPLPSKPRTRPSRAHGLGYARTCYDHLAGRLGVAFTDFLGAQELIRLGADERLYELSATGKAWLREALDIELTEHSKDRRPLARACLDWTERRPHLAGALGCVLLRRFLGLGWLRRTAHSRALALTAEGRQGFAQLGFRPPQETDAA
ncbi:MAG: helix-turn-helix transcriptional regulator [Acetobacteraceae bacterium]|nr:helix-turn-helix transcriptional regulator [Acetobacteraceae bacterium]MBV8524401.1 helix-turn-helix transcriptional regulator [Acetobacteraceae bacterium]MBV8592518.1 helix-turn-helix transcriptional regulator [Acetobacteraceae bacterium]